jgi:hypothetical protein
MKVEGVDVTTKPLKTVKEMLRGPSGSFVQIVVLRENEGMVVTTLVRSSGAPGPPSGPVINSRPVSTKPVHKPETEIVPVHRLVTYDNVHDAQRTVVCDIQKVANTPEGFLDVYVIDFENLPIVSTGGGSLGEVLSPVSVCNPCIECSVRGARLYTATMSHKLSAAVNQTLRLEVNYESELTVQVMHVAGPLSLVIGEVFIPMSDWSGGRLPPSKYQIKACRDASKRPAALAHYAAGEPIWGQGGKPSSVSFGVKYNGPPESAFRWTIFAPLHVVERVYCVVTDFVTAQGSGSCTARYIKIPNPKP